MTQQSKNDSILNSIQAEVSKEASPLLEFIIHNSRKIIILLVLLIVAIAVAGGWGYFKNKEHVESREDLGLILVQPDSSAKTEALKTFLAAAPDGLRSPALLAMAKSAAVSGDHQLAADSWSQLASKPSEPIYYVAKIAQAGELVAAGQPAEALALLEAELSKAPDNPFIALSAQAADIAESLGNVQKALDLTKAVLDKNIPLQNRLEWEQRVAFLSLKLQ